MAARSCWRTARWAGCARGSACRCERPAQSLVFPILLLYDMDPAPGGPTPGALHEATMTDATEIARRRTFAIISHPDAGKTTLTEHVLRAGGAIQLAGNVRAKGERRRTRSDWMGIERERGIS